MLSISYLLIFFIICAFFQRLVILFVQYHTQTYNIMNVMYQYNINSMCIHVDFVMSVNFCVARWIRRVS